MRKFSEQKHTLEQGAVILFITAILVKLIGALFKIPLSSNFCLGDLGFGYFSSAYDLINPFLILSISGLPVAVSKIVSENFSAENNDFSSKTFFIARRLFLLLGLSSALIALIAVFPFTKATDGTGNSLCCFLAIIPSFIFYCLSASYRGYFEGITNMTPPAVSNLIEAISKLFLGFAFAFFTVRITGNQALAGAAALFGITLGTVFSSLYLHINFKRLKICNNAVFKYDAKLAKKIMVIAIPIALCSFSTSVIGLIDGITVRWQLNSAFSTNYSYYSNLFADVINEFSAENGTVIDATTLPTLLYGVRSKAHTVYNIIPTLTAFLGVSAVPHIAGAFKAGDKPQFTTYITKVLKFTTVISIPAGLGFIALNKEIITLLFGKGASSVIGGKMLLLYGIATVFSGVGLVLVNVLQGLGMQNKALCNVAVGVGVKIAFNLLLCAVPRLNIYGSVISTILCYIVIFILNILAVRRAIGFLPQINNIFLKPTFSAFVCCVAAVLITNFGSSAIFTLFSIIIAVVIYAVLILFLKAFSREELSELPIINNFLKLNDGKNAKKFV